MDRARLKAIPAVYRLYQLHNYVMFQPRLAGAMLADWRHGLHSTSAPLPPARLRHRVHGALDRESFVRLGRVISCDLHRLLGSVGRRLESFETILDFGCGCGRVLRFLASGAPGSRFYATDIDPSPIEWGQRHLPDIQWSANGISPPLPFASEFLDLVYAISVFSHLDEGLQNVWLAELERVARPGAILILTVHGESLAGSLAASERKALHEKGILFCKGATGRLKLDGLPDFYQSTFHTRAYIEAVWSRYFDVIGYVERAIDGYQDAILLRKRT
jgi:SAM-dependent methyltransferase